jgi:hypothetical protein
MKNGLLLGAGFSYDLGMPTANELTEVFLGLFNQINSNRLAAALSRTQPFSEDRPINKKAIDESFDLLLKYKADKCGNYEDLLSKLQDLSDRPGTNQSDRDSYHYVFGMLYEVIHGILSIYQAVSYDILYPKNLKWFSKLENLLSDEETWVFSLNHDLFFECLAIDLNIPVTYGDTGAMTFPISNMEINETISFSCNTKSDYSASSLGFIKNQNGVNLIKLHGSLSELEYSDKNIICNPILNKKSSRELMDDIQKIERMAYYHQGKKIPSGRDRIITNMNGELDVISKSMLTGGRKYSKTANAKKGEEKLIVFDDILSQLNQLTVIGYGFGDKHINFRISNAMARRDNLTIQVVDPAYIKPPEFLESFDYDSRIRMALCGAAHWMDYSQSRKWDAEQMESLKENAKLRTEIRNNVEAIMHANSFKI